MNKKIILSSILSLVICLSIVVGATFALFTSEAKTNIAVTSGTVNVEAAIGTPELYSPTGIALDGTVTNTDNAATTTFKNGGTATLSGNVLTLTNVTPGDKVTFPVAIDNNSNVTSLYRLVVQREIPEGVTVADSTLLFSALNFAVNGTSYSGNLYRATEWTLLEAGEDIADLTVEIEFPAKAGNDYQGLSTAISVTVEAVQGNAATSSALTLADLKGEDAKKLTGKLELGTVNATLTAENSSLTIGDSNLVASGVTELVFDGGVIDSHIKGNPNPTLEPNKNDWPHVYSQTNGDVIYLAAPAGSKIVFKNLTINGFYNFLPAAGTENLTLEFENCTLNGCWVGMTNGLTNIKFTGCHFTLDGIETQYIKNTNPIWIGPGVGGNATLSLDSCIIEGNRPVKYSDDQPNENGAAGTLNVTNCVFKLSMSEWDLDAYNVATDDAKREKVESRLTAIRFSKMITIGDISGNNMVGGYALYQTNNAPYSNADYTDAGKNNKKPEDAYWTVEY